MNKGLNVTLMTVAIAVMALQAMAMAPTIGDIKSPIVGKNVGVTAALPFVYPDAFDITAMASDDSTDAVNIRWSYYYTGTEVYRINNVDRVTVSDAAINNPAAARINGATTDPGDGDASAATITIRNVKYAPITGTGATPSGTIIDMIPVTLFASDGSTYSSKTVFFYTDNGGTNRLSGEVSDVWTPGPKQTAFPTGSGISWTWAYQAGTISSATNGGTAVCIDTAPAGVNFAQWTSSWGIFQVAQNTVYRIRARINGTQTQAERSPFFDLVLGNFSPDGLHGLNLFGGDMMVFDNEGGANAPMLKAPSGTNYMWYWAPACMLSSSFNASTVWSTANAENRKMYLMFRVLDLNSNAALTADNDSGVLCMNEVQIDSLPYSALAFQNVWTSPGTMSASNTQASDVFSDVTFDAGRVKITPSTSHGADSKVITYGQAFPGDATMTNDDFNSYTDNYPVTWEANTLYKVTWQWSALDAASALQPLDVIWTGMDSPTNELILNSYVTEQEAKAAMPKAGTAQDYIAFFYSHAVSNTTHAPWKSLRPRAEWANSNVLSESTSTGIFLISGGKVDKVTPQ